MLSTVNKYVIRFNVGNDVVTCTAHPKAAPEVTLGVSYLGIAWGDYDGDSETFQRDSGYALQMAYEAAEDADRTFRKLVSEYK